MSFSITTNQQINEYYNKRLCGEDLLILLYLIDYSLD